jgi:hypothetical protein
MFLLSLVFFETMRGWSLVQKPWLYRCERCNYELFCIVNRCKSGDKFQLLAWSSQFPKRGHTEPKTLATELRLATATWKLTKDLSPFGALGRPWTVFADLEHKAFQRIRIKHQQQLLNLRLKHWLTANVQVDASIPPDKEKREAQVQLFSFGTQNRQIVNSHPHPPPPLPHHHHHNHHQNLQLKTSPPKPQKPRHGALSPPPCLAPAVAGRPRRRPRSAVFGAGELWLLGVLGGTGTCLVYLGNVVPQWC